MLFALAGAALLVGAFIIFNTFSITVAQRTREFALLRALGSTRRQIVAAVAGEALILGLIASALGLLGGLGFAKLLGALFDAAGFGIPLAGMELAPRTIAVSLGVGVGVTLLAALAPRCARRAWRPCRRWRARPSRRAARAAWRPGSPRSCPPAAWRCCSPASSATAPRPHGWRRWPAAPCSSSSASR